MSAFGRMKDPVQRIAQQAPHLSSPRARAWLRETMARLHPNPDVDRYLRRLGKIVDDSLRFDKTIWTQGKFNERMIMARRLYMQLRKDAGYPHLLALEMLPRALRCKIDGIRWTVPKYSGRTGWSPEALNTVPRERVSLAVDAPKLFG